MIEIVKYGDSTLSCKCPECGWEFRFPLGGFIKFDSTGPVLTVESVFINCPDCGADVYEIWDANVLVDDLKRRKERWRL